MTKRAPQAGRTLLRRVLRKLNYHRTTELYFIGYPKTGNTWLRFMLGRYIQLICDLPQLPLFDETDHLGRCKTFCAGPAMQFTHRPLLWRDQRAVALNRENVIAPFQNKRIVLLVRHPLDTLVSHWLQRKYRTEENCAGSLLEFLDDPAWGIEKFIRFYSLWFEYRESVKSFSLLRYEDLRAQPQTTFDRLLQYADIRRQEDKIVQSVTDADFANMKKIELDDKGPKYSSSGLGIFATGDRKNPEILSCPPREGWRISRLS